MNEKIKQVRAVLARCGNPPEVIAARAALDAIEREMEKETTDLQTRLDSVMGQLQRLTADEQRMPATPLEYAMADHIQALQARYERLRDAGRRYVEAWREPLEGSLSEVDGRYARMDAATSALAAALVEGGEG